MNPLRKPKQSPKFYRRSLGDHCFECLSSAPLGLKSVGEKQKNYEQRNRLIAFAFEYSNLRHPSTMRSNIRQTARQRVDVLFQQAKKIRSSDPQLSRQYVENARKIAMSARMRLPAEFRRQFCKNCNVLLVQGENCRIRIKQRREPHVVITCLNCNHQTRILLRKNKEKPAFEQNNDSDETSR